MNWLVNRLINLRLFQGNLDLHLVRASMVIIYFSFGYQKWFDYEAQGLIPFFTHGPLIFWMHSVFGIKGSSDFLGVSNGCWDRCCWQDSGTESWKSWVRSDLWARSSAADDRAVSSREWTTRAGTRCSPNLASTPIPLRCSTSRGTIPSRGLCVTFRP